MLQSQQGTESKRKVRLQMNKKQQKQEDARNRRLAWILHEWDCRTVKEAVKQSQKDYQLRLALIGCGVKVDS